MPRSADATLMPPIGRLARTRAWADHRPGLVAAGSIFLVLAFRMLTGQEIAFTYDGREYWELAHQYWRSGAFDFQSFDSVLRGYLFPLLLAPLAWLEFTYQTSPSVLVRLLGAVVAALLFGVVAPGLWQAMQLTPAAAAVSWQRRLIFGALGLAFWRGYFNFPLTDFPALLALSSGLWALLRGRSVASGLLAGVAVAAAVNFRPIYLAALPAAGLLCLWPRPAAWQAGPRVAWGRRLAFVGGLALVGWPQLRINQTHFGANTPLVLAHLPGSRNLYLQQLQMGLRNQKYETSVAPDYPNPQMFFGDPAGRALWSHCGPDTLANATEYLDLVRQAPAVVAGVYGRHLFNALDVQYPMPYVKRVYVPTRGLAGANYTALFAGLLVLARRAVLRRRLPAVPVLLALAALLLPCLFVLPVLVECRFMLPLHLLLCAALAFGAQPIEAWQRRSTGARLAVLVLYAGWVSGAFVLSSNAQLQLKPNPRQLFGWHRLALRRW